MNSTGKLKDFCFAADENYSMPLTVCIGSLIWSVRHCQRQMRIHVLDLGIDDETWQNMVSKWEELAAKTGCDENGVISFVRHRIDKRLFDGMMSWHGSVATYARLLLPKLLPDVNWCLYSDGDVLFVESPFVLDDWCLDSEVSILGHKNPPEADAVDGKWFRDNQLPFNENQHVCAGFLLMNLEYFRQHELSKAALDFLRAYKTTASADQCAINYVCHGSLRLLPSRWGIFSGEIVDGVVGGGAIHYADGVPWKIPVNGTDLFYNYQAISDLWRRFAIEIVGVQPDKLHFPFKEMLGVRLRSVLIRAFLTASRTFAFPAGRYESYAGKLTKKSAITKYKELLFS